VATTSATCTAPCRRRLGYGVSRRGAYGPFIRCGDTAADPLWQWSNNVPYDANVSAFWSFSLPIAFGNKVCFQGGKNANRVFCLHQDRSFAFEADNSGYTESSGSVFQFLDYPVMASGRIVFGSTDFTTTVSANDGGGFFNIYNTNGGWPYGGSTAHGGTVIQQFIETDSGMEDLVVYQALESLGQRCTWKQTEVPGWDMSLRVPATDGKTIYATINRRVTAFDANTCAILWSVPIGKATGVSPAVSAGVAYFHNGTAMMALDGSSPLWVRVMPTVLSPIVDRGVIYGGAVDGTFWALRASDGSTLWSFQTQAAFTPAQIPALSGNLIYVPSADGRIYTLDAATGRQVDRFTGAAAWGPIIIAHGLLYSSDLRGNVYAFRPSSAR
jgi:outer membrane protein assembly factor BamB